MNSLIHLLHLSDPALPVGGFAHSGGLETYVQAGVVHDAPTSAEFIRNQLEQNLFYTDGALVSLAHQAASSGNQGSLIQLSQLCNAVKLPSELRSAGQKLGSRLLKIFIHLKQVDLSCDFISYLQQNASVAHYPVVFGFVAFELGIALVETLTGFYYNAAAGMVTNAVKLVPLGQLEGQEILFSLLDLINGLAQRSLDVDENMIGVCCNGFDIRSMQHEHLYSRLYMS